MDSSFYERYSRHFPLSLLGKENQEILQDKRVLVAGLGGLGTVSSELLASIGIGYLRIVDYDVVELSNLPRQKLYTEDDIGKAKVDVAELRLRERNPHMEVDPQPVRIDALSAGSLLEDMDMVIDGLDLFSTRKALFRMSRELNVPYLFCGSVGEQANIMAFTHKEDKPCLQCAVGDVGDNPENSCEILGVHPAVLQIASSIQVSEAVKILLDQEAELDGTMLYIDLPSLEFDKFSFQKNPECRICGTSPSKDELDTGKPGEVTKGIREIGLFGKALVTSLCGRDTIIVDPSWEIDWDFSEVEGKIGSEYHISVSGKNYLTFTMQGIGLSVLSSGVTTIRGAKGSKNAIKAFEKFYSEVQET